MTDKNPTSLIDRIFKDKHGKWAIAQFPNIPIAIWVVLSIISYFVPNGRFAAGLNLLRDAVLFTWAYLEISDGDSYFRRVLGVVVMVAIVIGYFS